VDYGIPKEGEKNNVKNQLSNKLVLVRAVSRTFIPAAIVMFVLCVTAMVTAQTSFEAPKPGPEHQKLAGLVGSWTTAGELIENPFGPAEKWSGKFTWEWLPGNFAVVRHIEGIGSVSGENRALDIIAYDTPAKTYTWYDVDNMGSTSLAKASISGDVLTAFWEANVKGKAYTIRGTLTGLGSDRATWVSEYSEDGKTWKAYFHATDTRVKPK
jgi:hypothetical protein